MKTAPIFAVVLTLISFSGPVCNTHKHEYNRTTQLPHVLLTSPEVKSVTIVDQYACVIHSRLHLDLRALERIYLEEILVKEGQVLRQGDVMFTVVPFLQQTRMDAALAENNQARLEYDYARKLFDDKVVSQNDVALKLAKVKEAEDNVARAQSELKSEKMKVPFDSIVDHLCFQQGSLVEEGEALAVISNNKEMWIYFRVPEASYHEYMANLSEKSDDLQVELVLASGDKFRPTGKIGAIGMDKDETGKFPFRADFLNPDGLLRHGQTGSLLIGKVMHDATVIPQRATFEDEGKWYVYVVDDEAVVHQREIEVATESDDLFVINNGICADDKIVLNGIENVRDGEKVTYDQREKSP